MARIVSKRIVLLGLLTFVLFAAHVNAETRTGNRHRIFSVVNNGVPLNWGWWGPWATAGWPVNPYGYSYWGYWNYQPYYASFGAISYSPSTDRFGYAWGQSYRSEAVRAANFHCGVGDCQNMIWVQGGCGAVASVDGGSHMGFAYHATKYKAKSYALRGCAQSQGSRADCHVRVWVCSY